MARSIFTKFVHRFFPKEKPVLGRWAIDYCYDKMNHKIDWSNEDHCGPCGQRPVMSSPPMSTKSKASSEAYYSIKTTGNGKH